MRRARNTESSKAQSCSRPGSTPEARESQLTSLAFDLVEQRLRDGTASSAETVHFLKLASTKQQLEVEKMKLEKELVAAKTQAIQSSADTKELYENALAAMRRYSGHNNDDFQ